MTMSAESMSSVLGDAGSMLIVGASGAVLTTVTLLEVAAGPVSSPSSGMQST